MANSLANSTTMSQAVVSLRLAASSPLVLGPWAWLSVPESRFHLLEPQVHRRLQKCRSLRHKIGHPLQCRQRAGAGRCSAERFLQTKRNQEGCQIRR
jgi:hypothetical protein